ncbi:MAG: Gfo/Idh/MocA family oxidoreductase [Syntrophaceae bacterium]|nr:Gfo/Idh/MocA family oxidoreductase [Syntrophaceae bacterium]
MAKQEKVGVALVGIGSWSGVIANAVARSKKVRMVTCYTRTPEKRQAFSKKYGCDQEKSFEDLLKRDDVEGILLTTPNAIHAEQTVLAAQHGKHVFVDKPIANTLTDARKMVEACEKAKVTLLVGHDMRRLSGFRKVKELIDQGAIGKPVMAESNFSARLGFELTPDKWRWFGDDSGCPAGALMTMGVHHADTLNYYFGPIQKVFAFFNKLYTPADVEDVTMTIFQFESGVLGYLGSTYASLRTNFVYVYGTDAQLFCTLSLPNVPFEEYLQIWSVVDRYTVLQILEKTKDKPETIPLPVGDPILEEIDEFADCIRTGRRPETDGRGALVALTLIRAAIDSARTGKPVNLKDL